MMPEVMPPFAEDPLGAMACTSTLCLLPKPTSLLSSFVPHCTDEETEAQDDKPVSEN